MRHNTKRLHLAMLICGLLAFPASAQSKTKKVKPASNESKDAIEVVGHVPLSNGPVRRFFTTQHFSGYYLYAERDSGKGVTLIDVSKVSKPVVLSDMAWDSNGASASLFAVTGTAAVVTEEQAETKAAGKPQTIRVMDFSDALHPKVALEFTGVTAIGRDERRGLIFVANAEGIWILRQTLAYDPEWLKEWERQMQYQ
jgi:hypothetical protein